MTDDDQRAVPSQPDQTDAAATLLDTLIACEAIVHHHPLPVGTWPVSEDQLDQLLDPAFHEVGRSGIRYDRATVLRFLASYQPPPGLTLVAFDHQLSLLSADLALLVYRSHQQLADSSTQHAAVRSSLWRRNPQGWALVYHQATPAP